MDLQATSAYVYDPTFAYVTERPSEALLSVGLVRLQLNRKTFDLSQVQQVGIDVYLVHNKESNFHLRAPMNPAHFVRNCGPDRGLIEMSIPPTLNYITEENIKPIQTFIFGLLMDDDIDFTIRGTLSLDIGTETITVPLDVPITFDCMQGMYGDYKPVVNELRYTGGSPDHMRVDLIADLYNTSPMIIKIGGETVTNVTAGRASDRNSTGAKLGQALFSDLVLLPGKNTVKLEFRFAPSDSAIKNKFVAAVLNSSPIDVTLSGFSGSTPVMAVQQAIAALHMPMTVTPVTPPLIRQLETYNIHYLYRTCLVRITGENPFDTTLTITRVIHSLTTYSGSKVSRIENLVLDEPVHVEPKSEFTMTVKAQVLMSPYLLTFLGRSQVEMDVTIEVEVFAGGTDPTDGFALVPSIIYPNVPNAIQWFG